ncbi:MAG: ribose-phosphate diphosphokinase, partial [Caulobacterales bacterium]|nr:ribose-phosphate diphosphokinase [Caulobacterales bacterium]
PTDNLFAEKIISEDIRARHGDRPMMIVSPDVGGVVRARTLAGRLGVPIAIVDKHRERPGQAQVMNVIGEVRDRVCILVDDIVDSGGTICKAAEALMERGAIGVSAYASHGVLSGEAVTKVETSPLEELVVTDSIEPPDHVRVSPGVREISVAPLIGEAIHRIANNKSISELFD